MACLQSALIFQFQNMDGSLYFCKTSKNIYMMVKKQKSLYFSFMNLFFQKQTFLL